MKGRKPLPTHLKLITGNPGRRPLNKHEAKTRIVIPDPPEMLSDPKNAEALKEWFRVTQLLAEVGLIAKLDRAIIAAYCVAWGRWIECEEEVRRSGMILRAPGGVPMYSPYFSAANRAMEQLRQFSEQIGLSGSARSRIKAAEPVGSEDPAETFLRGRA